MQASSQADIRSDDITHSEVYRGYTLAAEWTSSVITLRTESSTHTIEEHIWVGYIAHKDYPVMPSVPAGHGMGKSEFTVKGSEQANSGISMMFHPDYICVGLDGKVGNVSALGHGLNILCTKDRVFAELRQMADFFASRG